MNASGELLRAERLLVSAAVTAALTLAGCASTTTGASSEGTMGDRRSISAEELSAIPGTNLYDVLQRARPLWLTTSGSRSRSVNVQTQVIVVTDGRYFGGIDSLRRLPVAGVRSIRYLTGSEAANAHPSLTAGGHVEAAIIVVYGASG